MRSIANRLLAIGVLLLAFVFYLHTRDTVHVNGDFSPEEQQQIIAGIQEWSAPKIFRHIVIGWTHWDTVEARVREPGNHWSVTEFMKVSGHWQKCRWYLLGESTQTAQH